eukprot:TRINITY_DN91125_c0_g1_i1.p1 TRINITY_DN91125_c0_g1~~TRINITY_DN91125_c0_g1_i1.p1  ORF type:complete len:405 (-),score=72.96 TRINITY_DN91125_c0_g1_i1:46-1260(-)
MGATCCGAGSADRQQEHVAEYLAKTGKPYKEAAAASSAGQRAEALKRHAARLWASDVLLFVAYVAFVPGVLATHLEYRVQAQDSGSSQPVVVVEANTGIMLLCRVLWDAEGIFCALAAFLFLWGVGIPILKLIITMAYRTGALESFTPVQLIQGFGKWAILDAFIPMIWAGVFTQPSVSPSLKVVVDLHYGFYCFVSYCVLSTISASLLEPRMSDPEELPMSTSSATYGVPDLPAADAVQPERPPRNVGQMVAVTFALTAFFIALSTPIVTFTSRSIGLDEEYSVVTLAFSLVEAGLYVPAVLVAIFVAVLPAVDLMLMFSATSPSGATKREVTGSSQQIFSNCMVEVFMVATAICTQAYVIFGAAVQVNLTLAGWAFGAFAVIFGIGRQMWLTAWEPRRRIAL